LPVAPLLAWLALVACRVIARLISVGSGDRGAVGLALLTASVNAYWLVVGAAFAWLCRRALRNDSRLAAAMVVVLAAVVVLCGEPEWYRIVLFAFDGAPLPWREAVTARGDINVLIVALIAAACWLGESYRRTVAGQRQRRELESALADAELRALTLQLQPHFLFNTLQLAAEAAFDDLAVAKYVVRDLQKLLRRTFELEERSLVRVADEIEFLQAYVAIQQRRFGARLAVVISVSLEARELLLPPLLLQPLVENSIRHGIGPMARGGRIDVHISTDAQHLRIEVRDDGIGFQPDATSRSSIGLGIGVTRRRLETLFPNAHSFGAGNDVRGGAAVVITLPIVANDNAVILSEAKDPAVILSEAKDPYAPRRSSLSRPQSWPSWRIVAALTGAGVLTIANVIGAAAIVDRGIANPGTFAPPALAVWMPLQLLVLALVIVLWRANDVRRWMQARDAETRTLVNEITALRARIDALRSGKDLMLEALATLMVTPTADDFDRIVLESSDVIRHVVVANRHAPLHPLTAA
jgi:signal transduction histidine kinase